MNIKRVHIIWAVLLLIGPIRTECYGKVKGSPHDLSAIRGRGTCNYCHTPHGALQNSPLWNHKLSTTVYTIYQSSSLDAKVGQPTGPSKLCLSCHDGTVALTHTVSGKGGGQGVFITPGDKNLGTDLSDDHPISFVYSDALASMDDQIRPASSLPGHFRLDRSGEFQCTTCHDAHDNDHGNFLVMSNLRSAMCITCHDLIDWSDSAHEKSTASSTDSQDQYLRRSEFKTVADNGCLSCHRPHSAGGHERLLHYEKMERNCLNCHDGKVAATDLRIDMAKISKHDVAKYQDIHDLKESAASSDLHVECMDCHNPHSTRTEPRDAPLISARMNRISGISVSGSVQRYAQFGYEVCFKCHGDNPNRIGSKITRKITQTNTRLEFDATNPSFHPVVTQGVNRDVPSLITSMTVNTIIRCIDCHNSDQDSNVRGPHGSNYAPLLAYNYDTEDYTSESEFAYELCYQCHSRNSILNNESFTKHKEHLDDDIPCSACHDAHGISMTQGNSMNNTHLINFDTTIVEKDPNTSELKFVDNGTFEGECFTSCHNVNHSPATY